MIQKIVLFVVVFAFSNQIASQNLNGYKYASVPAKFSFLKEKDKYQLNTLTKLFMQKYGFEAYIEGEAAPYDFLNNNCNKVYVDLEKYSSMFITKLKVVLKDCTGKVLYTSREGTSKEKEYRVAYNEALRSAFKSFETLNHKYDEKIAIVNSAKVAVKSEIDIQSNNETLASTSATSKALFAQPIQNGFQLINEEPRVIMKLFKTSVKDFYTATKGDIQGVFMLKNNEWFFEYYRNDQLISEKVDVKF